MSNRPNPTSGKRKPAGGASARQSSRRVQAAAATGQSSKAGWIIGVVVLVVGIALIAAIVANRGGSSSTSSGAGGQDKGSAGTVVSNGDVQTGQVEVSGSTLPDYSGTGDDAAVGQIAPGLSGGDFAAQRVSISNDGKPKVIVFLAHWCPHCRAEVPRIQQWLDQNGAPSDVELFSVATATDKTRPNYPPSNWLVGEEWTVPVLVDSTDTTAARAFGLTSYPFFVAVGADGKVVQRGSGELTMPEWEALLQAARTGQAQSLG